MLEQTNQERLEKVLDQLLELKIHNAIATEETLRTAILILEEVDLFWDH